MQLVPPGNPSKEAVKANVERCVGTRSFEVAPKEACWSSRPALVAEGGVEQSD